MSETLTTAIADVLRRRVDGEMVVVFCSQQADVPHWQRLLRAANARASLVLAFDGPSLTGLLPSGARRSAAQLVTDRHRLLASIVEDSPLARLVDDFDPAQQAILLVTDPLDPAIAGRRAFLGAKHPSWAIFEHKSAVDTLWDVIGVERPESIIFDQPGALLYLDALGPADVVVSWQQRGAAPSAGGDGVRTLARGRGQDIGGRLRAMPRLAGTPCRLHGVVGVDATAAFSVLELLVPHRVAEGTFLCAGTCQLPEGQQSDLVDLTRRLGDRLRERLAYRGGFSVDGILTREGFRPTDLNTRITSAVESLPPAVRVATHASALLARAELTRLPIQALEAQVERAFCDTQELLLRAPLPVDVLPATQTVRWTGTTLTPTDEGHADGVIACVLAARGPTLTVRLRRAALPSAINIQDATIAAFDAADRLLGAGFGRLEPPETFDAVPVQRGGVV